MHLDAWTLGLQTANVLILVWLLQRFLYRPVVDAVARRQLLLRQRLDDAQNAREAANGQRAQLERERADMAATRETMLADARTAAFGEREAILAKAADEAAASRNDLRAELSRERRQASAVVAADAGTLAVRIARRLLERLPADRLLGIFVDDCCGAVSALPAERRQVVDEDVREGIGLVTATALGKEERDECQRRLTQMFGPAVQVRFEVDAALIVGVELRLRRMVIRNSWANDLDRLQQALAADGQPQPGL